MSELLDRQAIIDALSEKVDEVCTNDKVSADVVLGLISAMGVVKNLEPVKEGEDNG